MSDLRTTPTSGADGKTLVLAAADIVQLIGQTVALKKRGRDFVGLCPFHNEKTPSFHVSPDKQLFYCYGCKAGGNVFDFVMKRDRVEFRDALLLLADQFNVELPKQGYDKNARGLRQQLLDVCSTAADVFQSHLKHDGTGRIAREYLAKRGFNDEIADRFRIGLAPEGWDLLLKHPMMRKFTPELLFQAGLIKARDGGNGHYDAFRNRLMFPIRDEFGRIIAFGGRVMPGSQDPAKYLNSPETPLYSKSKTVFGLDLARPRIVESQTVAIVEGYTDVVMAHQFGASNVVSPLGTALTETHVTLLRRFANKIVLLFDGDSAGDLAVDRAVQLFLTQPIEIAIATLPDGKDPDEFLLENGLAVFDNLLKNATDALTFQWNRMQKQFMEHAGDLTGQQKAVQTYLDLLASARGTGPVDSLRWGAALTRASRLTGIPVADLNRRFSPRPINRPVQDSNANAPMRRVSQAQKSTARARAERWILGGLLLEPKTWGKVQQVITPNDFTSTELSGLARFYWDYQQHEGEPVIEELVALITDPVQKSLIVELAKEVETMNNLHRTLSEAVQFIEAERMKLQQTKLVSDLQRTDSGNRDEAAEVHALKRLQQVKSRTEGPSSNGRSSSGQSSNGQSSNGLGSNGPSSEGPAKEE